MWQGHKLGLVGNETTSGGRLLTIVEILSLVLALGKTRRGFGVVDMHGLIYDFKTPL